MIAERTPAANIRNWAITRARHLDGQTPMDRFMRHGFSAKAIAHMSSVDLVHTLRVLLDPYRADGVSGHVRFVIGDETAGLLIRNCVAVPTSGDGADSEVQMSRQTFHSILGTKMVWSNAEIATSGDRLMIDTIRRCFDHVGIAG